MFWVADCCISCLDCGWLGCFAGWFVAFVVVAICGLSWFVCVVVLFAVVALIVGLHARGFLHSLLLRCGLMLAVCAL